ncbi:MAG: hypothetical protein HKO66_02675 [Saprospiraceae bacterium]|nr:hypothetical protein [Bacteroidia bacterium]NNE16362.1 hypothetical protein [Saprospiraceae bacterium]NNL91118.1 hypothetical protein [Saprospiraceae bacterium]
MEGIQPSTFETKEDAINFHTIELKSKSKKSKNKSKKKIKKQVKENAAAIETVENRTENQPVNEIKVQESVEIKPINPKKKKKAAPLGPKKKKKKIGKKAKPLKKAKSLISEPSKSKKKASKKKDAKKRKKKEGMVFKPQLETNLDAYTIWINSLKENDKKALNLSNDAKKEEKKSKKIKSKKSSKKKDKKDKKGKKSKRKAALKAKISKSIVKKDDIATQTLAELYAEQGYIRKAIDIYERLSLKNPKKSSFFAALIEKLKKEI